jgi:deazaflavin-dependent oxidoreductase (nitroreductase family)
VSERRAAAVRRRLETWGLKALFRIPVPFARFRDGWLFGHRALLLVHHGRVTGRRHETMLEVIDFDAAHREAYVMAGFGRRAQWLRNLAAGSQIEVRMAGERYPAAWRELPVYEAVEVLGRYERRHRRIAPIVRRVLARLAARPYDGSLAARVDLVGRLPVLGLRPAAREPASTGVS